MEAKKVKWGWYRIVANGLLNELTRRKDNYQTLLDGYIELNSELQAIRTDLEKARSENRETLERQRVGNSDSAVAVQVIRERMRSEELPAHLASSRAHGMRVRNMELIRENEQLKRLLNKHGNH